MFRIDLPRSAGIPVVRYRIRENTAYTNVIMIVVSFMPLIYGGFSDKYGLRASFVLALGVLVVAALMVALLLPRRAVPSLVDSRN